MTGHVTTHRGRAQIQVRDASQIQVINAADLARQGAAAPAVTPSAQVVPWSEAAEHLGQTITAQGQVVDTHHTGSVTFLNFETQREGFYIVVFRDALDAMAQPPHEHLLGKTIRVTGEVREHRGRTQIQVRDASQIVVVD